MSAIFASVAPDRAAASEVRIPLTIDYLTIREALKHDLYTAPGNSAPLWNGVDRCQFLVAVNPQFSRAAAGVKLETETNLELGVAMGGRCVSPIAWNGIVEALGTPYFGSGLLLKFHFADLNLYNSKREKTMVVSRGFDLIKRHLIPRLETFSYDLSPAVNQLVSLADDASTPAVAARVHTALATLRVEPEAAAQEDGIRVMMVITIADSPTPTAVSGASPTPATPTALTPAELKDFQTTLDQWDAFLVFAIKQLGATGGDQKFRDDLIQILLDSRFRLVDALQNPERNAGPDPVRIIFLDEWRQLHDIVKSAATRGTLGDRALEFLSFISAGDALFALDQAAPALGMRISAQDLRQLAHIMAPKAIGDPLKFNYNEDAELKQLFKFPQPPALEGPLVSPEEEMPATEIPAAAASSTPTGSPTTVGSPTSTTSPSPASPPPPVKSPTPSPTAAPSPARTSTSTSMLQKWMHLFAPAEADAAETGEASKAGMLASLEDIAKRLRRAVVNEENAPRYREDMGKLLELSAQRELADGDVEADYRTMYLDLIKAAAWQESCWRQFVLLGTRVRWLESSTGDIGLMQVNKHVWRGFYDIKRLEWDVLYNAGAGAEILAQMLRHASGRPKQDPVPILDHLARSAYAAYNGGPDAYNRWRRHEAAPLRQIDNAFWEKYRAVKNGQSFDILSCAAEWGHAAGH